MKSLMNQSTFLLLGTALYFTACTQPDSTNVLQNETRKKEIISALVNDDQASSMLIDSLLVKRHGDVMTKMNAMMGGDKEMQGAMVDNMMSMCKSDDAMCKMMMDETMAMCDADTSKCKMMMASMESHPNVMKSMEGICQMKGMNMAPKKDDHSQHH